MMADRVMMLSEGALWPIPSVVVVLESCTVIDGGARCAASRLMCRPCHVVCDRRVTLSAIDASRLCTWSRHNQSPSRARFSASGHVNFQRGISTFELISAHAKACDFSNNLAQIEMLQGRKKAERYG